ILLIALAGTIALITIVSIQIIPLVQANGLRLEYGTAFGFMALTLLPVLAMMFMNIKTAPPELTGGRAVQLPGLTLGESLKTWRFWLLAACFVPISYAIGAIIPNIERVLTASGFGMNEAVGLATLTGLAVLGGRVIGGYLIDRFWAPGVAFVFLASPAFALWLLGHPEIDANTATIAILMIGFGAGVEYDFMAYMVSKYFGMRSYSAIYGAIYGFFALGAGLGPTILTRLADANGWQSTLTQAAIILFVSTLPLLLLGRYRRFDVSAEEAIAAAEETADVRPA
ncbi:MAG: MFS transporter, partial [Pseudomonadota bacterium]